MNFFERIRTGRLFFRKKDKEAKEEIFPEEPILGNTENEVPTEGNPSVKKSPKKKEKNRPLPEMPDKIIKFTMMDSTYILEAFELNFNQELNQKGQPGGLLRGGIMTLTISESPDYYINEWMLREDLQRDGLIQIFPNKKKVNEGAELVISFKDAYCIRYNKKIDTLGAGLLTTIVISPRYVKVGNEEFENRWKRQETLDHNIRSI